MYVVIRAEPEADRAYGPFFTLQAATTFSKGRRSPRARSAVVTVREPEGKPAEPQDHRPMFIAYVPVWLSVRHRVASDVWTCDERVVTSAYGPFRSEEEAEHFRASASFPWESSGVLEVEAEGRPVREVAAPKPPPPRPLAVGCTKASGIYRIWDPDSGDTYVGRAESLDKRRREHLAALRSGRAAARLQRAFDGCEGRVAFEVLDVLAGGSDLVERARWLEARELHWVRELEPSLNGQYPRSVP
jgi:hypothetical protein